MDEAWQRAVEAALGGEDPSSAQSLMLDGAIKCAQGRLPPRSLLEPLSQLRHLSIANTGISTLADFPRLPHLAQLVLSDNRIAGGLDHLVEAGLHSLRDLDLSNNKMQHLEDLSPLTRLNLVSLDLYECPVTRVPNYRAQVFGMIKSLKYLDKVDADNNERPESDDEESEEEDGEDANSEGVDEEDAAVVVVGQHPNGRDEDEDGGEGNEELDEEEEDEDGSYQEVVGVADVSGGAGQDEENGSDYEEVEDEDDEDGDNVVEVHNVHESEEELAAEDEDDDDDGEDEEEMLEQGPGSASGPPEGELEVQEEDENGELGEDEEDEDEEDEEDEDDEDVAVEEVEEDYGTDYLVQPIMQQEEDEGASDFEPGEGEEEDEEIEDDVEEVEPAAQAAAGSTAGSAAAAASRKKRSRDDEEIVDTREMSSERPHKR